MVRFCVGNLSMVAATLSESGCSGLLDYLTNKVSGSTPLFAAVAEDPHGALMRVKTFAHVDYHIRLWTGTQSLARAVNSNPSRARSPGGVCKCVDAVVAASLPPDDDIRGI